MGEVGAVIPEKPCESPVATPAATVPLNGDINGVRKLATTTESKSADEPMEVDTEDDSQVSSENGMCETAAGNNTVSSASLKLPLIAKAESLSTAANNSDFLINNKALKSPASMHSEENSRQNDGDDEASRDQQSNNGATEEDAEAEEEEHSQADDNTRTSSATTNDDENSQDAAGDEDAKDDLSSQGNDVNMSADCEETTNDNSNHQDALDDENTQSSQNSEQSRVRCVQLNGGNATTSDGKEMPQPCTAPEADKSEVPAKEAVTDEKTKENGDVNGIAKCANDSEDITIIESDEEDDVPKEPPPPVPANSQPISERIGVDSTSHSTPKMNNPNTTPATKAATVNDDTPVIIPSDSESDDDARKPKASVAPQMPDQTADEDLSGDDCVVIEDDDKSKGAADLSTRTPNRQRKSAVRPREMDDDDDVTEIVDDTPPSKKARTTPSMLPNQPQTLQIGQITIKDPRSLMQQFADPKSTSFQQQFAQTVGFVPGSAGKQQVIGPGGVPISAPQGMFPNNMRPSLAPLSAPPKLVPTSPAIAATMPPMSASNATLLPALTDDMFVLEAPSFIVPYIYEKPPCDNLKDLVAKLEKEIEKVREKIKEAKAVEAKGDDNEPSAEEKPSEGGEKKAEEEGSKKKKKSEKGPDDSWDEQDTSTDDEASDGEPRTKVLIKDDKTDINAIKAVLAPADAAKGSPAATADDKKNDPKNENYFESPLGRFFVDIGINLVQEYVQTDLLKIQKRKLAKSMKSASAETELAVRNLQKNIEASKKRNEPYKFEVKRCEFCNFKTESALVMAHHYETPHMRQYLYKCNLCAYETRPAHDILFHMEAVHNVKGRLEKALAYNQCPNCPFEENGKAKFARHVPVCAKKFRPEVNLQPPHDWEAPAKIPRFKARHGLVGTATAYQAMAAQTAAQKAQLAAMAARAAAPVNAPPSRNRGGRPPIFPRAPGSNPAGMRGNAPLRPQAPGVVLPTGYQITPGGQIIQVAGSNLAVLPNPHNTLTLQQPQQHQQAQNLKKNSGQQPSISITPLPRQPGNLSNAVGLSAAAAMPPKPPAAAAGMKPGQAPTGGKAAFVICEICDGYIKDLEQLRNHMQWMHKVKIHPKMIHNRPPLNCQKCQFRFFTDQGLERHLLGSHGLVTSSMQEAANKGKDAGRCPVCGRMYQWKLLNHVSRDHHMTLKPAHLSYKCTVCTATFGMYKQFENHVYTAHSTVAKKAMDGKKNSASNNSSPMAGGSNVSNLSGITVSSIGGSSRSGGSSSLSTISSGDSLLKPLKINDEITIIPQPASKSRVSNDYESYLVGKSVNKR